MTSRRAACRKQQALVWAQLLEALEAEARGMDAGGQPSMTRAQLTALVAEVGIRPSRPMDITHVSQFTPVCVPVHSLNPGTPAAGQFSYVLEAQVVPPAYALLEDERTKHIMSCL